MARLDIKQKDNKIDEQWGLLKDLRKKLSVADVTVAAGTRLATDNDSIADMQECIDNWAAQTQMKEGNKLKWKAADNEFYKYTKAEFTAVLAELKTLKAIRKDKLFAFAEAQRALLPLPKDHPSFTKEAWPT